MDGAPVGDCAMRCTIAEGGGRCGIMEPVPKQSDFLKWFDSVRGLPVPKFITGLRGTGKTSLLLALRERLLREGMRPEAVLYLDTADPVLRRHATHERMVNYILGALPSTGHVAIFIREAAALPGPEVVIGTLAASGRREVFATSSSRRLLDQGLAGYFSTRLAHFEVLPEDGAEPYGAEAALARWNEIFLHDVLAPSRILEVSLSERIAGWLSDNLGDALSLRGVAAAISPSRRILSPHTVEAYLASLEDAHLIEKVLRWDVAEEILQKTGYRYFFTDPRLRLARFGPAPADEARRMALNRAWLRLRRALGRVYAASGAPGVDFATCANRRMLYWRVAEDGKAERVHYNAQF